MTSLERDRGILDKQVLEKTVDASIPEAMVADALAMERWIPGWRQGLIPFAKDVDSNFLVTDANAPGCPVEEWDAEGEGSVVAKSFSVFFERYRNELLSGRFEYVEGIGIVEKIDTTSSRLGKK